MKKHLISIFILIISLSFAGFILKQNAHDFVDGLKFQEESQHFMFYCNHSDEKCLTDFSKNLESSYQKVCKDLQTKVKNKVKVLIYPDIMAFHKAYGNPQASNGLVASAWGDEIKMVSPLNPGGVYDYKSLSTVVIHEFTHIVTSSLNPNMNVLPVYLVEGLALHEANQMNGKSILFLKKQIHDSKIPTLKELENGKLKNGQDFMKNGGYQYSCTVVDFIIERFGYKKLIKLIKYPSKFEEILLEPKVNFENNWLIYLKKKYK